MKNCKLWLFLVLQSFVSCQTGVDIENTAPDDLMAVFGLICPADSIWSIDVYNGKKLGTVSSAPDAVISDATLNVSDGVRNVRIPYNDIAGRYQLKNPFPGAMAGTRIYLTVTSSSGRVVQAEAQVPEKPGVPLINNGEFIENPRNPLYRTYKFPVTWHSPTDYPYFTVWGNTTGKLYHESEQYSLTVTIFPPDGGRFPSSQQVFGLNGVEGNIPDEPGIKKPYQVSVTIANVEKVIYDYYKSFWELDDWQSNTDGILPNFREPGKLASNVKGGIGIFASYNVNAASFMVE